MCIKGDLEGAEKGRGRLNVFGQFEGKNWEREGALGE